MAALGFDLVPIDAGTSVDEARTVVREWLDANIPATWHDAVRSGGGVEALRRVRSRGDYEMWYPTLARAGLVAAPWPREYGGLGIPPRLAREVEDVMAPYNLGRLNILGLNLAGPPLLEFGTDAQKAELLPASVLNEYRWCQLFSEPGAGSDLASLSTVAVADADGGSWRVDGQKVWTTWAADATHGLLLARTDTSVPKRRGITYFVVEMNQPGVTVRPLVQISGEADFFETFLDSARVWDRHRIGDAGDGWRVAQATLAGERQMISGPGSGGVDRMFGRSVGRLVEWVAADAARRGAAVPPALRQRVAALYSHDRCLEWTNKRARDNRRASRPGPEASIGKLLQAEHNMAVQETWADAVGARVFAHSPDDEEARRVAYGFLRSRANTIEGGTSEVHRNVLGERILGLPREPDPWADVAWRDVPRT
ncbi:MAG: acyl-CoA dehydrogenase family protein [Acidimicrobiia bacterium]|nr:acyl-CoA dehydrogenase family protein [Acidimicrobiia bacterium]